METYLINAAGHDVEALIEGLDEPDEEERRIAEFALFAQGGKAIQSLTHALGVDDPALRREAAHVLAEMHLAEAAPALIQALNDNDEMVRTTAVDGLVALREDAVHPILERLAGGLLPGKIQTGLYQALQGLEEFGVLRGNLKHIMAVMKANSSPFEIQSVAQELLK